MLSGLCPARLYLEYCSAVWCPASDAHFKLLDRAISGAHFLTGVCFSVTILTVDLWQYCVYAVQDHAQPDAPSVWSSYLCRMCQCGLHGLLWSYIGILMCVLASEHRSCGGRVFYDTAIPGDILIGGHQSGAALPTIT